jgi:hypothetical protein
VQTNYIAKVWLGVPMPMDDIVRVLGLSDPKTYRYGSLEKVVGRVGERLWIVHLSWGSWDDAEKVKVFAIPGMDVEEADAVEVHVNQLLGGK